MKHISNDIILSDAKLNVMIFDMIYFSYLAYDNSFYKRLIKGAGEKIIQEDSVSSAISSIYEST